MTFLRLSAGQGYARLCQWTGATGQGWDGCTPGFGDYLLVKLVSSGVLRPDQPILEASMEMAAKLVPDRESRHGLDHADAMDAG
jgi:hypothetical protein